MRNKYFASRAIPTLLADSAFRSWTKNSSSSCPFRDEVKETLRATPNLCPRFYDSFYNGKRCRAVLRLLSLSSAPLRTGWLHHPCPTPLCLCLQAASQLRTVLSTVLLVGWPPQSHFYTRVYGIATIPFVSHNFLPITDLVLGLPELSHYSVPWTQKPCAATLIGSNLPEGSETITPSLTFYDNPELGLLPDALISEYHRVNRSPVLTI